MHHFIQSKCNGTFLYAKDSARQYSLLKIWIRIKKQNIYVEGKFKSSKNPTLCLHKGSPKDHVRNGCKLCKTNRYCEPHDYEYCCPCDWHRTQHERQLIAVENNIKK